ncbi:MAG: T9SS type A sorting domain-containing protein [Chlorobi bacterium]|nr:T9SS type A sorting domain-containing protein [Chlorobiota bacterium]
MKTPHNKFNISKSTLIVSIFALFFSANTISQDSIPNNSFEDWYSATTPSDWQTTNIYLPPGTATCTPDSNAYSGNIAIRLKTIKLDDFLIPGVATLGNVEIYSVSGGIPYTGKPSSLTGYVVHPGYGDSVFVAIQFFKNGQIIGGGTWGTTDSIPSYTSFSAPIQFYSNVNPDTMNIVLLTDPNKQGSTLIVDDLHLEIQTGTTMNKEIRKLHIYPNPATDELNIDPRTTNYYDYSIYSISGKKLQGENNIRGRKKAKLNILNPGTYIIVVREDDKVLGSELFIKSE